MINLENNNIDEKLVEWNQILEEIKGESELLIEDLLEGIRYVAAAGILAILLGAYVVFIGLKYGNQNQTLVTLLVSSPSFIVGLYTLNKYISLRGRYSRLFDLQHKLKK